MPFRCDRSLRFRRAQGSLDLFTYACRKRDGSHALDSSWPGNHTKALAKDQQLIFSPLQGAQEVIGSIPSFLKGTSANGSLAGPIQRQRVIEAECFSDEVIEVFHGRMFCSRRPIVLPLVFVTAFHFLVTACCVHGPSRSWHFHGNLGAKLWKISNVNEQCR